MKYTLKAITASLSPEKKRADGTVTTLLLRPLSWPAAWIFLALGFTPNGVTALSVLCCAAALVLSFFPYPLFHALAVVLFFAFGVLDCADGNMARTIGSKNPYGGWVDAAGGYFAYFAQLTAMGLSCALPGGDNLAIPLIGAVFVEGSAFPGLWILASSLAVSANLLMRVYHQAFKNAELRAGIDQAPGREKRFSEEIGITGYMPVLYGLGLAFGALPWVILLYLVIYGGGFLATALKLFKKASPK